MYHKQMNFVNATVCHSNNKTKNHNNKTKQISQNIYFILYDGFLAD